jgi:transcriptional regulator with XRE-family HTH domain
VADPPQLTLEALGRAVRALREERDMSQEELAAAAGISTPHLSYIERGGRNASVGVAARIARALGLAFSELVLRAERDR